MRPIREQTVLVTGATDGLGKAVTTELALLGATVLVHGRDDTRGHTTLTEIAQVTGNDRLRWYRADLADLDQVRRLATTVAADAPRLDALISNAGIGGEYPVGGRQDSADGIELRFAVNYLAGFLLIRLLLPTLRASAPARIVQVSSAGQAPIDFDVMLTRSYSSGQTYCQSKLAQIMFTFDLAEELAGTGVTATALHPATYMHTKVVATPISTLKSGVDATVRLVLDRALDGAAAREAARARGRQVGPPTALTADQARQIRALRESGESVAALVATFGVSRATVYRALAEEVLA